MAKRETNAQRAAREYKGRTDLIMADAMTEIIRSRRENKADLAPEHMEDLKESGRIALLTIGMMTRLRQHLKHRFVASRSSRGLLSLSSCMSSGSKIRNYQEPQIVRCGDL